MNRFLFTKRSQEQIKENKNHKEQIPICNEIMAELTDPSQRMKALLVTVIICFLLQLIYFIKTIIFIFNHHYAYFIIGVIENYYSKFKFFHSVL